MSDFDAPTVHLFTDGACSGNPGPGGWGFILRHLRSEKELEDSGGEAETTNNRMELTAVVEGLRLLSRPCYVELFTDSVYVGKGMTEWIHGWIRKNWVTASKQPVKNKDLWLELKQLSERHKVKWIWVRGHNGHPENERADVLANQGVDELY